MTMSHNHPLRAELDQHELAALQRFMAAIHEEPYESNPRVDVTQVFRGSEGQIFVPVTVSGTSPDPHLAMLMSRKSEQFYKQSGCRFVILQRIDGDPQRTSYVWDGAAWKTVP
jgi:hypothetical protein